MVLGEDFFIGLEVVGPSPIRQLRLPVAQLVEHQE